MADPINPALLAALQQQQAQAAPPPAMPDASVLAAPQAPPPPPPAQVPAFAQQQAQALAADPQQVTEQKSGPVKRFLTSFLLGAGDAARAHVGLETSSQQSQREFQQGIAQQNANTTEGYRQAMTGHLQAQSDQLNALQQPFTFDKDDQSIPQQFRGATMTTAAANGLRQVFAKSQGAQSVADTKAQNALDVEALKQAGGNPKDHQITSIGGRRVMVSKRDGSIIKDLGLDTAMITGPMNANARAAAQAKYGVANVMDEDGNPTAVSRLQQLQSGAPTMTEKATQNLAGDKVGVATYLGASKLVENNLHVLRDPSQRAIIARATDAYEKDPGAFSAILNSSLQGGLSPEGAQLIGGLKQMNEFGASFKKYTGNGGAATDSLRNTIHGNQASAQNSEATNLQLIKQDRALAAQVGGILGKPGRYSVPARGGSPAASTLPATAPTGTDPFAAFGGRSR